MKAILIFVSFLGIAHIGFTAYDHHNHYILKNQTLPTDTLIYKVYKIDSIHAYYLIYARQNGRVYKILSPKAVSRHHIIEIGKSYDLKLHSLLLVNGKSIIPPNQIYELSSWRVDDSTSINFEGDSIRNIFVAENIKGLSYQQ